METLNKKTVGLVLGMLLGLWHLVWSILVVTGMAQTLLNWIYSIHFLNNPFKVMDFSFVHAITLIVVTSIIGYVIGYIFAGLWNMLHKRS